MVNIAALLLSFVLVLVTCLLALCLCGCDICCKGLFNPPHQTLALPSLLLSLLLSPFSVVFVFTRCSCYFPPAAVLSPPTDKRTPFPIHASLSLFLSCCKIPFFLSLVCLCNDIMSFIYYLFQPSFPPSLPLVLPSSLRAPPPTPASYLPPSHVACPPPHPTPTAAHAAPPSFVVVDSPTPQPLSPQKPTKQQSPPPTPRPSSSWCWHSAARVPSPSLPPFGQQ